MANGFGIASRLVFDTDGKSVSKHLAEHDVQLNTIDSKMVTTDATLETINSDIDAINEKFGRTINLSGKIDYTKAFDASMHTDYIGEDIVPVSIQNVTLISENTFPVRYYTSDSVDRDVKYQRLQFTLDINTAAIGDVLVINSNNLDDTDTNLNSQDLLLGAYEIIAINGMTVDVISLSQYTPSTMTLTMSGFLIKTVIRFNTNIGALVNEHNKKITFKNIAVIGACFPYLYNDRNNLYDPAGNKGGVTGIIARRNAQVTMTNCAVLGFSGTAVTSNDVALVTLVNTSISNGGRNGISSASTSKTSVDATSIISHNLLDGVIAQDSSFMFSTNVKSIGNGRHGFISSGNSSLNSSSAISSFNGYLEVSANSDGGDGFQATSSQLSAISAKAYRNANSGLHALGNATIRATSANVTSNKRGVYAETQSQITVNGTVNGNVTDLVVATASYILASACVFTTYSPLLNTVLPDGSFIQSVSTVSGMKWSQNGTNVGMQLNTANQLLSGFDSAQGISARGQFNGNLLANGDLYLKNSDGKYYKISLVNGTLTITSTAISPS